MIGMILGVVIIVGLLGTLGFTGVIDSFSTCIALCASAVTLVMAKLTNKK